MSWSYFHFGGLRGGEGPLVVGTICQLDFLRRAAEGEAGELAADIIEIRLDETGWSQEVLELSRKLVWDRGATLLATIRSSKEGGKFEGSDSERLEIYKMALEVFNGADVELGSGIARDLVEFCESRSQTCVISFHNFQVTPSLEELRRVYEEAAAFAPIVKIVTMLQNENDLAILRELLASAAGKAPLCLMGMGPLGRETRLDFPLKGSALTYGYLDAPAAPGQLSAAEITRHLKSAGRS